MSIGGAVFVFSLFLMPYVLLVTRSFFNRFPVNLEEASLLLGKGPVKTFFRIVLPMSRGAIIGGVVLVILSLVTNMIPPVFQFLFHDLAFPVTIAYRRPDQVRACDVFQKKKNLPRPFSLKYQRQCRQAHRFHRGLLIEFRSELKIGIRVFYPL